MNLLGLTVTHKIFGEGTIIVCSEDYVTVEFASKATTFKYPDAFGAGFIKATDSEINIEIVKLASEKAQKIAETKARKEAEEQATKQKEMDKKLKVATNNKEDEKEFLPIEELHIGDKFNTIVEVMNSCFGWNYKACMRGFYFLDDSHQYAAWFPKLSVIENGTDTPGDKWHGWINILSEDGEHIYMRNDDEPQKMNELRSESVDMDHGFTRHITFAKRPGGSYEYVGVFIRNGRDAKLGHIYDRVAKDFCTRNK